MSSEDHGCQGTLPGKAGQAFSLGIATRGCHLWAPPQQAPPREKWEETDIGKGSYRAWSGQEGGRKHKAGQQHHHLQGTPQFQKNTPTPPALQVPCPVLRLAALATPTLRLTLSTRPCSMEATCRSQPRGVLRGSRLEEQALQTGIPAMFSELHPTNPEPLPSS